MGRQGCTPVLEVNGFPVIVDCYGTLMVFVKYMDDVPVYAPISLDIATNIIYRYRGEMRKKGMEDKIKIYDEFIKEHMLPIEHKRARRAVMRAALRAYHRMGRELGLGKVLATAWKIYRWKGSVKPEDVVEELRKEMVPA